jgi:hypothetical protein
MKKAMIIVIGMFALVGCLDAKPKQTATGPSISNAPKEDPKVDSKVQAEDIKDSVRKDVQTSQNAIQQNMQSAIGLGIGKVSDELVHMNNELKAKLEATIASNNKLEVELKNQIEVTNKMRLDVDSLVKINNDMKLNVDSLVKANLNLQSAIDNMSAQVGIGNKLESIKEELKQTMTAGHDVNSSVVQFNREVLEAMKSANDVSNKMMKEFAYIFVSLFGAASTIVSIIMRNRAKRAETREATKDVTLQRALAALPPTDAQRVMLP